MTYYNHDDFLKFIVDSNVAQFGKFILKSGKTSEVFFDFGELHNGSNLKLLGEFYADYLIDNSLDKVDALFGPAYKGINIVIATSIALYDKYGLSIPFAYNRKIQKTHAEGGNFVGYDLSKVNNVLIVDDVFTDGGTKYEAINLLSQFKQLTILGIIVGIDRQEMNENGESYISLFQKNTGVEVYTLTSKEKILLYDK